MGEDRQLHQVEDRRAREMAEELFDPREAAVYLTWHEQWLKDLLAGHPAVIDALAGPLLANGDLFEAEITAIVAAVGGVALQPLPDWKTVRKAALENADPELEFIHEGFEPVTVTLRLPHFVHAELQREVERRRGLEEYAGRREDEIIADVIRDAMALMKAFREHPINIPEPQAGLAW